jgi:antitoxin component YwqK of YwqJK toxin-antitoxin module
MKRKPFKFRVASGCVALAMATGISTASQAEPIAKHFKQQKQQQASEAAPANEAVNAYAEVKTELAVPGEVEIVRERYADGKVRIERQVTLDSEGNYVNHGAWKQYSQKGDVIAEGTYNFGLRAGMWTRWIGQNEKNVLHDAPFNQFKPPFMSQANFANGKMDGEWFVTDANERKMLAISLKGGQRDGQATIWMPNGKVYWQMTYDQGVPVGDMWEVNKQAELKKSAVYDRGRKVVTKTDNYAPKKMKSQIMYLAAPTVEKSQDDFWSVKLAQFASEGADTRHGACKSWYSNGQQQMDGNYDNGKKTGTFSYWHENGQVSVTGEYRDDKAEGTWVWWHPNGQKSAVGKYDKGALIGEWRWWDDSGKLTKQQTYTGTESAATEGSQERMDLSERPAQPWQF